MALDVFSDDGSEKTVILRAIQTSNFSFTYDKIDPDCGKFILIDVAALEQRDYKDLVILTKSQKVTLSSNSLWITLGRSD